MQTNKSKKLLVTVNANEFLGKNMPNLKKKEYGKLSKNSRF
jgi:hypothetical protein